MVETMLIQSRLDYVNPPIPLLGVCTIYPLNQTCYTSKEQADLGNTGNSIEGNMKIQPNSIDVIMAVKPAS